MINGETYEAGSYRDRNARIIYSNGRVLRGLNEAALGNFRRVSTCKFYQEASAHGAVIGTQEISPNDLPPSVAGSGWSGFLEHQALRVVSYPYEWSFGMLKDAALLQLELLERALNEDFILKDSSAYNTQWRGTSPVFIDVASFEPYEPGDIWAGYAQFCRMFLFPLFIEGYKGAPFQPLLRSSLEGPTVEEVGGLFSVRDLLRRGIFKHVFLQRFFQRLYGPAKKSVRQELKNVGFHKELILQNVRGVRRLVSRLYRKKRTSAWADYESAHTYAPDEHERKKRFVEKALEDQKRRFVLDLGCNTGTFSEIAAKESELVVAVDSDPLVIDLLYERLKVGTTKNILPLVVDIANPSPAQGWRGKERQSFASRVRPDLILALAVMHHAVITAGIPLEQLIEWFAELGGDLVIEFVQKDDAMVKRLLANKRDEYDDYREDRLIAALKRFYDIQSEERLSSRLLMYCRRRGA